MIWFWKMTVPGVVATLAPTSKADSSVIEIRPLARSSVNNLRPSVRLLPPVSSASCWASGLVIKLFAGLSASVTWRSAKLHCPLLRSSSGDASSALVSRSTCARYARATASNRGSLVQASPENRRSLIGWEDGPIPNIAAHCPVSRFQLSICHFVNEVNASVHCWAAGIAAPSAVAVSTAFCQWIRSVNQRVESGAGGDMASTPRLGQKRERGPGRIEPPRTLGDAVVHGRHPPTQGCYDSVHTATPSPLTIATATLRDGGVSETCDRSRLPTRFLELRSSSTGGTSRPSSARR